jgi:hypothetical protein
VLVEQVDAVGPQPLQGSLDGPDNVVGSAVETGARGSVVAEAEFGGDHDLVADRFDRLPDQGFVGERPVRLGGVEEREALVVGAADQADAVLGVDRVAVVGAQTHAAQTDR